MQTKNIWKIEIDSVYTYLEVVTGFIASKIKQIDRTRARHEVDGKSEDKENKECNDGGEIVAGGGIPDPPPQLLPTQCPHLRPENQHQHRNGGKVYSVIYQVVVP